jgi:FMN phosphatase YigB (HAD superfamily)
LRGGGELKIPARALRQPRTAGTLPQSQMEKDQKDRSVSVLITDLDNTLWNWFELWYSSFRPLLDALREKLGIPEEVLKAQIKKIHENHHTSEYSRLLQELPCIKDRFDENLDYATEFAEVINAYKEGRQTARALYPGVLKTHRLCWNDHRRFHGIAVLLHNTENSGVKTRWVNQSPIHDT